MNLQLEDKTALVSGSSQGIGFAIAEALAKEGATVVINSNKQELVDRAVDRLSKQVPGVKLIGAAADLSTGQGVEELVKKVPAVHAPGH
jgi:NAD(P)-dependent dehydrogenase (short-subunit alcohol dehydrogenase family)